jgi:AraC family transcriptional regulator, regulatory protein of adaptative response / methylated-DNA-[protein]-cysteine methyltransferase
MTRILNSDEHWRALVRRDPRFDGVFYYGVQTTGVYCKPSCSARRPRRENVVFHATTADAERQGYRACRRCRPDRREGAHDELVQRLCVRIERAEAPLSLAELSKEVGLSPYHLQRVFKRVTGLSPKAFAQAAQGRRLRKELSRAASVTHASYSAGVSSSSRLHARAKEQLGMTPSRFRRGGAGERIWFAVGRCSLGALLVAETERGVCAVLLGDEERQLQEELRALFPNAELLPAGKGRSATLGEVVAVLEQGAAGALPLDLRGTLFQQRVWEALRKIPRGETRSYSELALSLGVPDAVRAVASACARNQVALLVPCHRVLRADGSLAGYRWGLGRKRELLERESGSPLIDSATPEATRGFGARSRAARKRPRQRRSA